LTEIQFTSPAVAGGRGGAPSVWTAPRSYQVQVSEDGRTWGAPIAEGHGTEATTTITFAPVRAKFIRITQTATVPDALPWSMRLLRLYEAAR
jgi:F5/8 type C domain